MNLLCYERFSPSEGLRAIGRSQVSGCTRAAQRISDGSNLLAICAATRACNGIQVDKEMSDVVPSNSFPWQDA